MKCQKVSESIRRCQEAPGSLRKAEQQNNIKQTNNNCGSEGPELSLKKALSANFEGMSKSTFNT